MTVCAHCGVAFRPRARNGKFCRELCKRKFFNDLKIRKTPRRWRKPAYTPS